MVKNSKVAEDISKLDSKLNNLLGLFETFKSIDESLKTYNIHNEAYRELFTKYISSIVRHTDKISVIYNNLVELNTYIKKFLNNTYRNLNYSVTKTHGLVSHLSKQLLTDETLRIVSDLIIENDTIKRVNPINGSLHNIDMPIHIKGDVGELIVEHFLNSQYPDAIVINQSKKTSVGDLVMKINGKTILIEVKNWHELVNIDNIDNFYGYMKSDEYDAGILVNLDKGEFLYNKVKLAGLMPKDGKILLFVPALTYNMNIFKEKIDALLKIL